ncbi:hypothetical protein V5O48_012409 [Marasmius crinis-equi]|uniref:Transmembrane protein n=1 Tax=Marasmius crinis-equi TaxID=585013 RepID=A0ABR3F3B2_9AGAR
MASNIPQDVPQSKPEEVAVKTSASTASASLPTVMQQQQSPAQPAEDEAEVSCLELIPIRLILFFLVPICFRSMWVFNEPRTMTPRPRYLVESDITSRIPVYEGIRFYITAFIVVLFILIAIPHRNSGLWPGCASSAVIACVVLELVMIIEDIDKKIHTVMLPISDAPLVFHPVLSELALACGFQALLSSFLATSAMIYLIISFNGQFWNEGSEHFVAFLRNRFSAGDSPAEAEAEVRQDRDSSGSQRTGSPSNPVQAATVTQTETQGSAAKKDARKLPGPARVFIAFCAFCVFLDLSNSPLPIEIPSSWTTGIKTVQIYFYPQDALFMLFVYIAFPHRGSRLWRGWGSLAVLVCIVLQIASSLLGLTRAINSKRSLAPALQVVTEQQDPKDHNLVVRLALSEICWAVMLSSLLPPLLLYSFITSFNGRPYNEGSEHFVAFMDNCVWRYARFPFHPKGTSPVRAELQERERARSRRATQQTQSPLQAPGQVMRPKTTNPTPTEGEMEEMREVPISVV